jgi:hypothetical protein
MFASMICQLAKKIRAAKVRASAKAEETRAENSTTFDRHERAHETEVSASAGFSNIEEVRVNLFNYQIRLFSLILTFVLCCCMRSSRVLYQK